MYSLKFLSAEAAVETEAEEVEILETNVTLHLHQDMVVVAVVVEDPMAEVVMADHLKKEAMAVTVREVAEKEAMVKKVQEEKEAMVKKNIPEKINSAKENPEKKEKEPPEVIREAVPDPLTNNLK